MRGLTRNRVGVGGPEKRIQYPSPFVLGVPTGFVIIRIVPTSDANRNRFTSNSGRAAPFDIDGSLYPDGRSSPFARGNILYSSIADDNLCIA
jgi:hypothetical protein